jgi:hypothetical protein
LRRAAVRITNIFCDGLADGRIVLDDTTKAVSVAKYTSRVRPAKRRGLEGRSADPLR